MYYHIYFILLLISAAIAYPHLNSNEQLETKNEKVLVRRQIMFPRIPIQEQQQQQQQARQGQLTCLPAIWTCGPGLPPCCHGFMCYDGNAKRGRHCIARG